MILFLDRKILEVLFDFIVVVYFIFLGYFVIELSMFFYIMIIDLLIDNRLRIKIL